VASAIVTGVIAATGATAPASATAIVIAGHRGMTRS